MALLNGSGDGKKPVRLNVRARSKYADPTPQENATLLSQLGGATLSGLHTVGSILSAPSRALWGTINGLAGGEGGFGNMNPFDSTNGIELSHVLGNLGVVQKNDPNKWEWMDPVRGLIDIAGDPTTYINPLTITSRGAQAIKAAGKAAPEAVEAAAKAAGHIVPDATQAAAKATAGVPEVIAKPSVLGNLPPALGRDEVLAAHTHPFSHLPLADQIEQGYRGVGGVQLPFMDPLFEGFTGPGVASLARQTRIPQVLDRVGKSAPARMLSAWFDARTRNVSHPDLQPEIIKATENTLARNQNTLQNAIFDAEDLKRLGIATPDHERQLRMALEEIPEETLVKHGMGGYDQNVLDVAARLKSEIKQRGDIGVNRGEFNLHVDPDTGATYFPRGINPNAGHSTGGVSKRSALFGGHELGTLGVESVLRDPQVKKIIDEGIAANKEPRKVMNKLVGYLRTNYGEGRRVKKAVYDIATKEKKFVRVVETPGPKVLAEKHITQAGKEKDRMAGLAKYLYENPTVTEHGLFTNHPLFDNAEYLMKRNFREEMAPALLDAAAKHIKRVGLTNLIAKRNAGGGQVVPLKTLISTTGMKKRSGAQFVDEMAKRLGMPAEKIKNIPIEADFAAQAARSMQSPIQQSAVPEASNVLKSLMTMWKARTLAHPSTRTRDYLSAVVQNKLLKHSTGEGSQAAKELLAGKNVTGFADDPLMAMQMRRGGYEAAPEAAAGTSKWLQYSPDVHGLEVSIPGQGTGHATLKYDSSGNANAYVDMFNKIAESGGGKEVLRKMASEIAQYNPKTIGGHFTSPAALGAFGSVFGKHRLNFKSRATGQSVPITFSEAMANPQLYHSFVNFPKYATPDTETMALRAALGAGHPVNHGITADIPMGQPGATLVDILQNSPGHEPRSWGKFAEDMKQLATGHTFNSTTGSWEPTPWKHIFNPGAARGAFGFEKSLNPRYAMSEYLAHHGDTSTRMAGSLGQATQGQSLAEAMRRTNSSLVNYDPNTFSNAERTIKSYGIPFYSFASRMAKHTLGELATNPGGLTAQMTKASNRASQGDPSAPDEVLAGASIPFKWPWLQDDGSKNYLSGLGLMHEDPINKFGAFLGGDIKGGLRGLGGTVGPFFKPPIEMGTGVSLFNGGDLDSQDPSIGRTLSNVGYGLGLYGDKTWEDVKPVSLGDGGALDRAVGYSPFGRDANTLRMLSDVRPSKSVVDKALQLSTGYRTTSITPERQQKVIRQRFEKAAKGLGAREISNVSFTKEQMESIRKRDPQTAEKLERLQAIIRQINQAGRKKKKKGGDSNRR